MPPPNSHNSHITTASMADIDAMAQLETAAHIMPWSAQHIARIVQQQGNQCGDYTVQLLHQNTTPHTALLGYFVALLGYCELHLLNLAIAPQYQRAGYAYVLLQHLRQCAIQYDAHTIWLEVRQSNTRAQQLYRRFGFVDVGVRASYYSTPSLVREDALVMQYTVPT